MNHILQRRSRYTDDEDDTDNDIHQKVLSNLEIYEIYVATERSDNERQIKREKEIF